MDKNIAAILREDTKTCKVVFKDGGNTSSEYTYITHLDVKVDDWVVVQTGNNATLKVAQIAGVDDDLEIEPNSDMKFKWIIDVIDLETARANLARNQEIEKMLASTYRTHARQAYAAQFLNGADPKVIELVKGAAK
jgi:hypothetical protein